MDLPSRPSERVAAPEGLADALGVVPVEVFVNAFNYMAVLGSPTRGKRMARADLRDIRWVSH